MISEKREKEILYLAVKSAANAIKMFDFEKLHGNFRVPFVYNGVQCSVEFDIRKQCFDKVHYFSFAGVEDDRVAVENFFYIEPIKAND